MKNLKAIFVIALAFVSLILITAIISMRTEVMKEQEVQADEKIVEALQAGEAYQLSTYFSPDVNFFIPDYPTSNDSAEAYHLLQGFFTAHPVKSFQEESIFPGSSPNLSYLQGLLHTYDQDFNLYATIYDGKIERFDLNVVK
jgi:hypothetical protein